MTTMNQFIPPQRKLDRSVSKVDGPAKVDGHLNQVKRQNLGFMTVYFCYISIRRKIGVKSKVDGHGGFIRGKLDGRK